MFDQYHRNSHNVSSIISLSHSTINQPCNNRVMNFADFFFLVKCSSVVVALNAVFLFLLLSQLCFSVF